VLIVYGVGFVCGVIVAILPMWRGGCARVSGEFVDEFRKIIKCQDDMIEKMSLMIVEPPIILGSSTDKTALECVIDDLRAIKNLPTGILEGACLEMQKEIQTRST
jgi:hypothetical protein